VSSLLFGGSLILDKYSVSSDWLFVLPSEWAFTAIQHNSGYHPSKLSSVAGCGGHLWDMIGDWERWQDQQSLLFQPVAIVKYQ
jgi:hypothetical protein